MKISRENIGQQIIIGLIAGLILLILQTSISYLKKNKIDTFEKKIAEIIQETNQHTNNIFINDGLIYNQINDTIVPLNDSIKKMKQRIDELTAKIKNGEIAFSNLKDSIEILQKLSSQYINEVDRVTRKAIDDEITTILCLGNSREIEEFDTLQHEYERIVEELVNIHSNCR